MPSRRQASHGRQASPCRGLVLPEVWCNSLESNLGVTEPLLPARAAMCPALPGTSAAVWVSGEIPRRVSAGSSLGPGERTTVFLQLSRAILGEPFPTTYVVDSTMTNKLVKRTSKPLHIQG